MKVSLFSKFEYRCTPLQYHWSVRQLPQNADEFLKSYCTYETRSIRAYQKFRVASSWRRDVVVELLKHGGTHSETPVEFWNREEGTDGFVHDLVGVVVGVPK